MRLNNTAGDNSRTRKLCSAQVREIRGFQGKKTAAELAKRFKVHEVTINKIWNRVIWKSLEGNAK